MVFYAQQLYTTVYTQNLLLNSDKLVFHKERTANETVAFSFCQTFLGGSYFCQTPVQFKSVQLGIDFVPPPSQDVTCNN